MIKLDRGKDKVIINRILELNLTLLASINILIKIESHAGIEEITRCYIETSLLLIFILKDPLLIEKRTLAYEYFYEKNKINPVNIKECDEAIYNNLKNISGIQHYDDSFKKESEKINKNFLLEEHMRDFDNFFLMINLNYIKRINPPLWKEIKKTNPLIWEEIIKRKYQ